MVAPLGEKGREAFTFHLELSLLFEFSSQAHILCFKILFYFYSKVTF